MVSPISFNNFWHALLSGCICPYVINMGSINCCSIEYWCVKLWSSFGCVEFWSNMLILKSSLIIVGRDIGIRSKNFWMWIMNIDKDNVEGMFTTIIWIAFLVFALNVAAIYLVPKDVKVLCDDKVVKLSYIIIVPFWPFTWIIECVFVSMFKDVLLDVNVLKCVSLRYNMWIVLRL